MVLCFYGGVGSVFWGWCHDLLIILAVVQASCTVVGLGSIYSGNGVYLFSIIAVVQVPCTIMV
jgi:hypothetical protein